MSRRELIEDDASQYDSINARLKRLEQGIPEDPHYVGAAGEPAFQNSWVNFDAAAGPTGRAASFYRHNGRVYLGGVIKSGASGTIAFTLPVGYRPMSQTPNTDLVVSASGGPALTSISPTTGEVKIFGPDVATFCFLEGSHFRHA